MVRSLPNWLTDKYFALFSFFSFTPFRVEDAKLVLDDINISLLLYRMCEYGWVDRVERGVYRVVHPFVALMEASGFVWRNKIKQRDRLPVLELCVARLFEVLGSRLESIVLFGSLSKGTAKPESDIDLLVVAKELPESYSERTSIIHEIVSFKLMDDIIIYLWKNYGIYADLDILLIDERETNITHPFYLDMVKDAIIIYDKNNIMSNKIEEVRKKLEKIGAKRFEEPDGSWYWILSPAPDMVREIEL
ncbi:MAG: nucleotidyltransferase domain-containing protein [Nitrososphaeria archaeon]|nr:nucleotidyltransferase domain-containing protein [Nitrososphaeria archaeon]